MASRARKAPNTTTERGRMRKSPPTTSPRRMVTEPAATQLTITRLASSTLAYRHMWPYRPNTRLARRYRRTMMGTNLQKLPQ
jgi:hypothetical protein